MMTILAVAGNINIDNLPTDTSGVAGIFAAMGAFFFVFAIIAIAVAVMLLLDAYDLVMRDKAEFPSGEQGKKNWFLKLFILPIGGIIPFVGFLVYVVWIVFVIMYFFTIRGKGSKTGE